MGQIVQKEAAPEVDLESGQGACFHTCDKRSEFLKLVIDEAEEKKGNVEGIAMTVKLKKSRGRKKAGKPPRHPRGPSLVAADRRFIEQMVLKRIEIERLKESSRQDAALSSSSKENFLFLLVIIVLCLLILFRIFEPWRRWSAGIHA